MPCAGCPYLGIDCVGDLKFGRGCIFEKNFEDEDEECEEDV